MTVSSSTNKVTYAGDGSTTVFAFTFAILDETHFTVEEVNDTTGVITAKTLTTHYTVSGTGNDTGLTNYTSGNITMGTAPASGVTLVIRRNMPFKQETDYVENDTFPAETHEQALDELTMNDQQQQEILDRTIQLAASISGVDPVIAEGTITASHFLRVNSSGTGFEFVPATGTELADDDSPVLGANLTLGGFDITGTGNINITGAVTASGAGSVGTSLTLGTDIIHAGDTDTKIAFTTDAQDFQTGGSSRLDLANTGVRMGGTGARVSTILDEDNMASNSNSALATQQSIKAYHDSGTATLTNKTINMGNNTLVGTTAQFNSALSDGSFATLAGTETLTNKTLTAAKIANGGFLADANGNEILVCNTTASAVNHPAITNAATGSGPTIGATGSDTNIPFTIYTTGTGQLTFAKAAGATELGKVINSSGATYWKFTDDGSYRDGTGARHEISTGTNGNLMLEMSHRGATPAGVYYNFPNAAPNDRSTYFQYFQDSSGLKFAVWSDGGITSESYHLQPSMPAFLAYNSATDTNQTGNGTAATVQFNTEVFDRGSDFASNTFTAPVTGIYHFDVSVYMTDMTNATYAVVQLITSNRTYESTQTRYTTSIYNDSLKLTVLADLDAADTAYVQVTVGGIGADTADIYGTTAPRTYFSGHLVG